MDEIEKILPKIINKQEANVLIYLIKHDNAMGIEIETGAGMRQPQMCIATNNLLKKGFIQSHEEHTPNAKGRPRLRYTINKEKIKEWLVSILKNKEEEIKKFASAVEIWEKSKQ